jgi:hypothetical protein
MCPNTGYWNPITLCDPSSLINWDWIGLIQPQYLVLGHISIRSRDWIGYIVGRRYGFEIWICSELTTIF